MDLSKAFDCITHDLLIAKLHVYGFSENSLAFFYYYLKGRKQNNKIKVNKSVIKLLINLIKLLINFINLLNVIHFLNKKKLFKGTGADN